MTVIRSVLRMRRLLVAMTIAALAVGACSAEKDDPTAAATADSATSCLQDTSANDPDVPADALASLCDVPLERAEAAIEIANRAAASTDATEAPAATLPATTAPPAPTTTAAPEPVAASTTAMPDLYCWNLQDAQDEIQRGGVFFSESQDASGQGRSQVLDSNWVVVDQTPAPGTPIGEGEALLYVLKYSEPNPCS